MRVRISNTGDKVAAVPLASRHKTFLFRLVDDKGIDVPLTRMGERLENLRAVRGRMRWMTKENPFSCHVNLARLFDLSEVGRYSLTISKSVKIDDELVSLTIEKILLVVREPMTDVVDLAVEYGRSLRRMLPPD